MFDQTEEDVLISSALLRDPVISEVASVTTTILCLPTISRVSKFFFSAIKSTPRTTPLNIDIKITIIIVRPGSSAGQMNFKRGTTEAQMRHTLNGTRGIQTPSKPTSRERPRAIVKHSGADNTSPQRIPGVKEYKNLYDWPRKQHLTEMSPPVTPIPQSSVKYQKPQTQHLTPTVNIHGAGDTMGSTGGSIWDGTVPNNSKGSVFSQLEDFPCAKNMKPDPSLPSTICRVFGRFSRYLPTPSMFSMCISRATQVIEKERHRQLEQEEKLKFQNFAEDNDKYDLEVA
ncbi:hypothetical protein BLNAU_18094 [Blattamonas nauphoetae]|uniref:Uncharacterized protein n=1 Tax=Blattamonas nauphoetae TaxID=2049346 RepID=A0ABQ9X5Y4_9EUKA|nr:hypothetical protein BLNAU_18094 [Blattamonas nauphoetae]